MSSEIPTRISGEDALKVIDHWMVEGTASLLAEGRYAEVDKLVAFTKSFREAFGAVIEAPVNPLNLTPQEKQIALGGNLINAIKEVRARTGCGLKQAKLFVEAFMAANGKLSSYTGLTYSPNGWPVSKDGTVPVGWTMPDF